VSAKRINALAIALIVAGCSQTDPPGNVSSGEGVDLPCHVADGTKPAPGVEICPSEYDESDCYQLTMKCHEDGNLYESWYGEHCPGIDSTLGEICPHGCAESGRSSEDDWCLSVGGAGGSAGSPGGDPGPGTSPDP